MKIGRTVEIEKTEKRIIPLVLPPKREKPEEEGISVPNWPQKEPVQVPAGPEKKAA